MMPAVQKFAQDKSWRVRYNVAQQLYSLCETVGPTVARRGGPPARVGPAASASV